MRVQKIFLLASLRALTRSRFLFQVAVRGVEPQSVSEGAATGTVKYLRSPTGEDKVVLLESPTGREGLVELLESPTEREG
jgi:hypothetical protein